VQARIPLQLKHTWVMMHKKVGLAVLVFLPLALIPGPSRQDVSAAERHVAATPSAAAAATVAAKRRPALPDISPQAREVERLAQQVVAQKQLPGLAMAIVQGDTVVSMRAFGVTEAGGAQPVTNDTVFRLASLSKAFAATLSAQLVSEQAMGWDTPIINQLPAFKLRDYAGAQKVTVRDVLSHRVGLTRNTYDRDLERDQPYELLAEKLSDAPMACTPGDCYAYQNIAYSLIGDLVFADTGDFYSHQVEKRLFHPLGMYDSSYGRDALEASPSWARPHVRRGSGWAAVRPKETYYRIPPAAGVNSSIHDMAQWLIAQMGHRPDVLPEAELNEIHTPQVNTPGEMHGSPWRRERLSNAYYAMGWRVFDYAGHTLVFHGGAVQGYRGLIAFLPEQDVGIVVLWNSESAAPSGLLPSFLDRVLALPATDWLGVDGTDPAEESHD
jgi:beta-lactamase class C